jgi:hypothetical protein
MAVSTEHLTIVVLIEVPNLKSAQNILGYFFVTKAPSDPQKMFCLQQTLR